jgi:hypothetical protein
MARNVVTRCQFTLRKHRTYWCPTHHTTISLLQVLPHSSFVGLEAKAQIPNRPEYHTRHSQNGHCGTQCVQTVTTHGQKAMHHQHHHQHRHREAVGNAQSSNMRLGCSKIGWPMFSRKVSPETSTDLSPRDECDGLKRTSEYLCTHATTM